MNRPQIATHLANLQHPDSEVRDNAAKAHVTLRNTSAIPALLKELKVSEFREFSELLDWRIRMRAAQALGEIGDPAAVLGLIEALTDKYDEVRCCAAYALGKIGEVAAIPALIDVMTKDVGRVSNVAARALGLIGDASSVPFLIKALEHLVPELAVALEDKGAEVRSRAAEALGRHGDSSVCAILLGSLHDVSASVRWDVAYALEVLGNTSGRSVLFEVFQNKESRMEVFAEKRGTSSEDTNRRIVQIPRGLSKIGVPVVPALLDALMEANSHVRLESAKVLRDLGTSHTLPRKILAEAGLTTQEKLDVLDRLRQVHRVDLRYRFPDTPSLCQQVLTEEDPEACDGAQSVLNWITLLRGSQVTAAGQSHELVRPVMDRTLQSEPKTMLRAADLPQDNVKPPLPARSIWQRLFER